MEHQLLYLEFFRKVRSNNVILNDNKQKKKALCREIVSESMEDRWVHRGVALLKKENSMQRDEARPGVLARITRISAILKKVQEIFHEKICTNEFFTKIFI